MLSLTRAYSVVPGPCYQPIAPGQLITTTVLQQFYWQTFSYAVTAGVTKARFSACRNIVNWPSTDVRCEIIYGYRAEWGRPTNISAPLVPSVTYDRCSDNPDTDRTGQTLHVLISGRPSDFGRFTWNSTLVECSYLFYTFRNWKNLTSCCPGKRPCIVEIPPAGGTFDETPSDVGQPYRFSLQSQSGSYVVVSSSCSRCTVGYASETTRYSGLLTPFTLQLTTGTTYFTVQSSSPYTITFSVRSGTAPPGGAVVEVANASSVLFIDGTIIVAMCIIIVLSLLH
jgi:hypothetical protein